MSGNTSASGGYLAPAGVVLAGDDLDRVISRAVRGITGLAAGMVRPRWQPIPPAELPAEANWCAIGVMDQRADFDPMIAHDSAAQGSDTLVRNVEWDVMASFYGPGSAGLAMVFRDGFDIPQNREALSLEGIKLGSIGPIRQAPEIVQTKWRRRHDLMIMLRGVVKRRYNVLNILSAAGAIHTPDTVQPWAVEN